MESSDKEGSVIFHLCNLLRIRFLLNFYLCFYQECVHTFFFQWHIYHNFLYLGSDLSFVLHKTLPWLQWCCFCGFIWIMQMFYKASFQAFRLLLFSLPFVFLSCGKKTPRTNKERNNLDILLGLNLDCNHLHCSGCCARIK